MSKFRVLALSTIDKGAMYQKHENARSRERNILAKSRVPSPTIMSDSITHSSGRGYELLSKYRRVWSQFAGCNIHERLIHGVVLCHVYSGYHVFLFVVANWFKFRVKLF